MVRATPQGWKFLLLRAFDYWVSYVFSAAMTVIGVLCLTAARRQHERELPATASR